MVAERMVGEQPPERSVEQRNLQPTAYKNADGSWCAVVRIIEPMDESLILSACSGEPREFCYEMKGDSYRFLEGITTGDAKSKVAEETMDVSVSQSTVEVPKVRYINKINDVSVVRQDQVPIIRTVQRTVKVPQVQFHDRAANVPVSMQRQAPRPERIVEEIIEAPVPHVMEKTIEVVKFASKPDGRCAAQAPEWEQRQRERAEELAAIHETNKLLNNCDELIPK